MDNDSTKDLHGLVDMGSNGIRFSISSLAPPTARIMPTIYQSRAGISLYDAQYPPGSTTRQPIPAATISLVLVHLLRFKAVCASFSVPPQNISLLATEATRTAPNSEAFLTQIRSATGWNVTLLSKSDEGRIGALGVASSLGYVYGLMMDLGGGSTQLTWLSSEGGQIRMPDQGSVSMPYGAAALSRRLQLARAEGQGAIEALRTEIEGRLRTAYETLDVPKDMARDAQRSGGFTLYLSGGGFRGWGFVLLSRHKAQPYPVPIINGFAAEREVFLDTDRVEAAVQSTRDNDGDEGGIFRISDRRASQVPAVSLLVSCLANSIPLISSVRFCQGGVREGHLFSLLDVGTRAQTPLEAASYGLPDAASAHTADFRAILTRITNVKGPSSLPYGLVHLLAAAQHLHSPLPKDARPSSALRASTTGALSGIHGLAHEERALVSLALCERWGKRKDLPPADQGFYDALAGLLGAEQLFWAKVLGKIMALIGEVAPCPKVPLQGKVEVDIAWEKGKKGDMQMRLRVKVAAMGVDTAGGQEWWSTLYGEEIEAVVKAGKRKNWIDGIGWKIHVDMSSL